MVIRYPSLRLGYVLNVYELGSLLTRGIMGKRKSKRKPPPKQKRLQPLDALFDCPFCNHEKSCDVELHKEKNVGLVTCRVCLEDFQTPITYLSEKVDVYSDWIDACEAANAT